MELHPGDTVQFGGKSWQVNMIDQQRDAIELVRVDDNPLRSALRHASGSPFVGSSIQTIEVTAEQLMREQVEREAQKVMDRAWGRIIDPKGMEQARAEAELKSSLMQMGIEVENNSALAAMLKAIASQFAAVSAQAGPTIGSFKSIADMMGDFTVPDEEETRAARKAELDAQYTEPEGDGFFVFYRKPDGRGPDIVFQVDGMTFPPPVFTETVHRCDTIDDAWAFVDYLKDDEAGQPICIREDSCVLFYRGDAGWEALTRDPVPDEYREE